VNQEWTDEELATLAAIEAMTEHKYVCTIVDHDHESDEFLVQWQDDAQAVWQVWFSRRFINEVFTEMVLN
jgi:predicted N-acetyltransferase YhbS